MRELNDRGIEDIIVVDHIAETDKWMSTMSIIPQGVLSEKMHT